MPEYAALIAIDWADQKHAISLYDQSTGQREQTIIKHTPNDRTRVSNRLTALLKGYFPQVLDWFDDIRTLLVCDFLQRWPQLSVLQRVRPATLNKFFRSHHSTSKATNQRRLAEIKTAVPLTNDAAVINSSLLNVKALITQMKTVIAAISEYDRHIEALCQTHDDYQLFASLPGAGPVYAARLPAARLRPQSLADRRSTRPLFRHRSDHR